jgi:hypothetical protein
MTAKQSRAPLFEELRPLTHTCWIASSLMLLAMTEDAPQALLAMTEDAPQALLEGVAMPGRRPRSELRSFFVIAIASSLRSSQ